MGVLFQCVIAYFVLRNFYRAYKKRQAAPGETPSFMRLRKTPAQPSGTTPAAPATPLHAAKPQGPLKQSQSREKQFEQL